MKRLSLLIVLIVAFGELSWGQTFHNFGMGAGGYLISFNKEFPNATNGEFSRNLPKYSSFLNYSNSLLPIEINFRIEIRNKEFGGFERDAIYELNGLAEPSRFVYSSVFRNISYGINFFLFKNQPNFTLSPPEQATYSSNSGIKKRKFINPFLGFGIRQFEYFSGLGMQTLDFDYDFNRGSGNSISFYEKKVNLFYLNGGIDFPINYSLKTNSGVGVYPHFDGVDMFLRYTINYQRNPSLYLHNSNSLGQDFLDSYQPYMDFNNPNEMIKIPLSNWSHSLHFVIRINLNPSLSREKRKNMEAQEREQEGIEEG